MPEHNLTQSGWNVKYILTVKKDRGRTAFSSNGKESIFSAENNVIFRAAGLQL